MVMAKTKDTTVWTETATGNDKDGHEGDRLFQKMVLSLRSVPAQGEDLIKPSPFSEMIPENGNVRDQADIEIDRAGGEIECRCL